MTNKAPSAVIKSLCPEHRRIAFAWRNNTYSIHSPREWGGGHIMDNRTSHAERRAAWDRKNEEQVTLTVQICQSGTSPQCITRESS